MQAGREKVRAGRKRDAKGGGSGAPDPRTARQAGYWGVSRPPPRHPPAKAPGPRPPRDPAIPASPAARPGGHIKPCAGPEPTSSWYLRPQRRERRAGGEKMAKTLPAHPKSQPHPPHPSAPAAPGRPPRSSAQAPAGFPSAPLGLGRDAGASGSEWGVRDAGRVPTAVSPAGALLSGRPPRLRGPGTGAPPPG